jgi:site-specific DNA recombinase
MRAAVYARYSSDNQREASIVDQVRLCQERIDREGWSCVEVFSDAAMSGANLLRPGVQGLLSAALSNKLDVVVAEALDRLSRDQEDVAGLFKRLRFAGVRLITLTEGEITDLHVGLKGTMNALYLSDLADKTRRGLRGRVEAGRSGGGNSFGYDVVDERDGNGDPVRGGRVVNEAQAEVARRIYADYVAGKSPRAIAFALNAEGISSPGGKGWGMSTINGNRARGTGILNNELYIGRLVWNRLRYVKNPDTGKRVSRLNPEADWIIQEVPDLRIIDQELWDAVKDRQDGLSTPTRPDLDKPFWTKTRPKYLLSGLMKCDACGGSYTKISQNLFGCATARNKGICDNRLNIRTDHVEAIILDGLKSRLMDPELFKVFTEEFTREVNKARIEQSADHDSSKAEIDRVSRQIDKLVMAVANGADALALNVKIKELEVRRTELESQLAKQPTNQPLLHPSLAGLYRAKVAELARVFDDPDFRDEAFELIRSLIDEVRLIPEDGQLRISLKGELAGIIAVGEANKKPAASEEGRAEQIKMVAGVGFEPTTFRL